MAIEWPDRLPRPPEVAEAPEEPAPEPADDYHPLYGLRGLFRDS